MCRWQWQWTTAYGALTLNTQCDQSNDCRRIQITGMKHGVDKNNLANPENMGPDAHAVFIYVQANVACQQR